MRKSGSVVRRTGSARISVMRTRQASARTFAAIAGHFEVFFLACAEVRGQPVHAADEIGNGVRQYRGIAAHSASGAQPLADNGRISRLECLALSVCGDAEASYFGDC